MKTGYMITRYMTKKKKWNESYYNTEKLRNAGWKNTRCLYE